MPTSSMRSSRHKVTSRYTASYTFDALYVTSSSRSPSQPYEYIGQIGPESSWGYLSRHRGRQILMRATSLSNSCLAQPFMVVDELVRIYRDRNPTNTTNPGVLMFSSSESGQDAYVRSSQDRLARHHHCHRRRGLEGSMRGLHCLHS
jgi:hypothetical protein